MAALCLTPIRSVHIDKMNYSRLAITLEDKGHVTPGLNVVRSREITRGHYAVQWSHLGGEKVDPFGQFVLIEEGQPAWHGSQDSIL